MFSSNLQTNALTSNGTDLLARQNGEDCRYPYPESLGIHFSCVERYGIFGWIATDPSAKDLLIGEDILVDVCISNLFSRGSIVLPTSSNISVWRDVNGTASLNGTTAGIIMAENAVLIYGYTLITINSLGDPSVPGNPTTFEWLYSGVSFDILNQVQFWQFEKPGIKCQTLGLSFVIFNSTTNDTVYSNSTFSPPVGTLQYQIPTTVFDQCVNDFSYFVGFVAGIGGALIVALLTVMIISLVKSIKRKRAMMSFIAYNEVVD